MNAGTWLKLVRNSTLAATLVTAAQVGIGSGVGIIDWQPGLAGPDGWRNLLTWVVFMFAVGTVAGAAVGQRFVPVRLRPLRPFQRFTAAAGAAFGALLALAVVWLPVSVAHTNVSPHPELTVALAAGIGVLLGLAVAVLGLVWGGVTAGAALTVGWVWLLAVASALLSARNHAAVTPGLGLLDAPSAIPPSTWWSGPFLMVGLSAIFGLAVAAVSGWRGAHWPGVALSGVVGPALIAAAYLTTGWVLAMAGLTVGSGAAAPVVAALIAAAVGLTVSAAVAAPQQRRNRVESFGSTHPRPVAQLPSAPIARPRKPLAITASGEKPYEPIYLAPTRSGSSPVTVYSADPYSSDAFEVSSRAFDTVSVPPPRSSSSRSSSSRSSRSSRSAASPPPVVPPAPPSPSRPAPEGPAVPPTPARPPAPGYAAASVSSGAPVKPVSSYPGGADVDVPPGLFAPAPAPPVQQVPTSKPSPVEPSRLVEQGYAQPAGPSEPGFDERVYRMPAPGSKASPKPLNETKKAKGRRGAASAPAPSVPVAAAPSAAAALPVTPSAPAAAARGSVPSPTATRVRTPATPPPAPAPATPLPAPAPAAAAAPAEPTLRVPPPPTPPTRSPVADPPATTTARPAPAAGPAPSQPTTRRARKQARAAAAAAAKASAAQAAAAAKASAAQAAADAAAAKASAKASAKATKAAKAAPEPVSPLRAGSIEGEVLSESTQPTSGAPDGRRGRSKDRPLRKGEREHIDWVTQLVQIEHDSVLKTSKER